MVTINDLRPGDVLFYKTTKDSLGVGAGSGFAGLRHTDFTDFRVLAAYAQGYPYAVDQADPRYRPWYHVALVTAVDGGSVNTIQFDEGSSSGDTSSLLTESALRTGLTDPPPLPGSELAPVNLAERGFEILRPPNDGKFDVDECIAAARRMLGSPYALAGLLGFALVTQARMLPAVWKPGGFCLGNPNTPALRVALLSRARSYDAQARKKESTAESCVSAVARAIEAGSVTLFFTEPAAPTCLPIHGGHPMFEMIRKAIDRLLGGGLRDHLRLTRLHRFLQIGQQLAPGDLVSDADQRWLDALVDRAGREAIDLHGSEGPPAQPGSGISGPDLVTTIHRIIGVGAATVAEYIEKLEAGAELLLSNGGEMSEDDGAPTPSGPLTSQSYLVSPAMLWEALLSANFTQVL